MKSLLLQILCDTELKCKDFYSFYPVLLTWSTPFSRTSYFKNPYQLSLLYILKLFYENYIVQNAEMSLLWGFSGRGLSRSGHL